ncbi:hypothetical protein M426DRAFT_321938 [Hypoxylon sp. CI-4A]|nr:hypothetical protein M426DRAFT_321938 [Hypoxylon sp. CI-4A]
MALCVLYTNAQGQGRFGLRITGPGDRVLLGEDEGGGLAHFVQYSCNSDDAPDFPSFGGVSRTGVTTVAWFWDGWLGSREGGFYEYSMC